METGVGIGMESENKVYQIVALIYLTVTVIQNLNPTHMATHE